MSDLSEWKVGTEILLEMGRITRGNLTRDEALQAIARLLVENLKMDMASIMVYDPPSRSCYVSASCSRGEETSSIPKDINLRLKPDSKLWEAISSPSKPVISLKGVHDSVLGDLLFGWVAIVPMNSGPEVTGLMILAKDREEEAARVNPEILMTIGSQAALIAIRASLVENLRLAEERYRMLVEDAADLVFVLDGGGRFIYVNSRCKEMLGYEPEEMVGRYFGEFVSPESWARTVSLLKQAVSKKEPHIQYSWLIQTRWGSAVTLEVRASLLFHDYELFRHQGIARDIFRETRLEEELKLKSQELAKFKSREEVMKEYLSVANMAQEEERARIAREIHDGPIQYLIALRRRLDLLRKEFPLLNAGDERPDGEARKKRFESGPTGVVSDGEVPRERPVTLSEIDDLVDQTIRDLRQFARTLRPPVLDDFGLVSACEWLCDQARKERKRVNFKASGRVVGLTKETETSVFRIAQEAISNIIKHSDASLIDFSLDFQDDCLIMSIEDNGKGFDPPSSPGSLARAGQMGLIGMYERAEILGATLSIESHKGQGTRLCLKIPLVS